MNPILQFILCLTTFKLLSCDNKALNASASREIERIHMHVNEKHFSEIIIGTSAKFRDAKKGFLPYLERKRDELGIFQQGKTVHFRKSLSGQDTWLDLRLDWRFEKGNAQGR